MRIKLSEEEILAIVKDHVENTLLDGTPFSVQDIKSGAYGDYIEIETYKPERKAWRYGDPFPVPLDDQPLGLTDVSVENMKEFKEYVNPPTTEG